jgi:hypothetical protein
MELSMDTQKAVQKVFDLVALMVALRVERMV